MTRTAGEIAEYLRAELSGDSNATISGVASPERAGSEDLIYVDSARHVTRAAESRAKCVVARDGIDVRGKTVLKVKDAKFAFAKAANWILPQRPAKAGIHPTAIIASTVRIGLGVSIGPYVVIEEQARIGSESRVEAFCHIGRDSQVGENCWIHSRVTLYPGVRLGKRVQVHAGAVIGADGFGYVYGEGRYWKFPQIGAVEIGDDVEIGANATIDRGSLDNTHLREGVKIDNLVQIAHNVQVGEHSVIAAQTGISGSSKVGNRAVIGGQAGIADHCTIEEGATVGAQAGVPTGKTIRAGQTVWGTPAREIGQFKEQYAYYSQLPQLAKRIKQLEEQMRGESPAQTR